MWTRKEMLSVTIKNRSAKVKIVQTFWHIMYSKSRWLGAFSALTLLVGSQEEHLAYEWWGVNVVICLDQDADCLHMVQLMPLPSPSSFASFKSRLVLHFGYSLTQVVLEKKLLNGCSSCDSKSRWLLIVACQTRNMMRSVGPWHNSCHQFMIDWSINARK